MNGDLLSTGQAAKLCSVTPDTVLRWIRSGRLRAQRTPGGHYRVAKKDLREIQSSSESRPVRYCWEFNAEGREPMDGCESCIVYRSRTLRCYELAKTEEAAEIGFLGLYCDGACDEDCEYYRVVRGQATNVIVVSRDKTGRGALIGSALESGFNIEAVESGYALAARVESFRPDYVVLDLALGDAQVAEISESLLQDPRLRLVRIILAVDSNHAPKECNQDVFATLEKPLTFERLKACLTEIRSSIW